MKKITLKNRSGFTLIELLIVIGMMGVVMGAIYSLYSVHQKSASTQVEVVDVQQNLRIAMESISRDVRMAGFLIPRTTTTPVLVANNATGVVQPLPAPDNVNSDAMTLNTASATETYAAIASASTSSPYVVAGSPFTVTVDSASSVDSFNNNDYVRIIGMLDRTEPKLTTEGTGSRVYKITGTNRATPSLTLSISSGSDPTGINLSMGDMICKTSSPFPNPNTVRYCLGPVAGCGVGVTTCPAGQLCLIRVVNSTNTPDVIAQNMAGLQFRYLLEDGSESDVPIDYNKVRAVRVTLTGQTVTTKALSDGQAKERQLESVIQIKNR